MGAPYPVALAALDVLANRDDRAPVAIAVAWAKALISAGYDENTIMDLARVEDPIACRRLLAAALVRFGLGDLTEVEKARLARAALTHAFLDRSIGAPDFATRLVRFMTSAQDELSTSDAFAREYRFLFEIDEMFNYMLAANAKNPGQWSADLRARGVDPADPRLWVLRRMRALGFVDEADAPLAPAW